MSLHLSEMNSIVAATILGHAAAFGASNCVQGGDLVQVGPRPAFLVNKLQDGPLKSQLAACKNQPMKAHPFSIGHRGAALMFPEHTVEGYTAAADMGAGIIECDVTFTKDQELVCRHSQCDLHQTTNILATPLASKCSGQFTPHDAATGKAASANCCTSDVRIFFHLNCVSDICVFHT
jgi:glycerophosphoryl diester phosphodiesterase